ncbi:MAG: hypothetical protein EXR62_00245 [Chloroflexi bacterium]|nr:hypothetical protein [Chloroflexota bacterium]
MALQKDRFLMGIVTGAVVLILLSLGAVVLRGQSGMKLPPENTPEGIAFRYFEAARAGNPDQAFNYLYQGPRYPSKIEFFASAANWGNVEANDSAISVMLLSSRVSGDQATVTFRVTTFQASGPFSQGEDTRQEIVSLIQTPEGWRVTRFFFPYWDYRWGNDVISPPPPPKG